MKDIGEQNRILGGYDFIIYIYRVHCNTIINGTYIIQYIDYDYLLMIKSNTVKSIKYLGMNLPSQPVKRIVANLTHQVKRWRGPQIPLQSLGTNEPEGDGW